MLRQSSSCPRHCGRLTTGEHWADMDGWDGITDGKGVGQSFLSVLLGHRFSVLSSLSIFSSSLLLCPPLFFLFSFFAPWLKACYGPC